MDLLIDENEYANKRAIDYTHIKGMLKPIQNIIYSSTFSYFSLFIFYFSFLLYIYIYFFVIYSFFTDYEQRMTVIIFKNFKVKLNNV